MMEKEKLRKADIYSGAIIFLFGVWIISQALKMPMKDSWGGVQNVWYVSPALFPLFVGSMITLLGAFLFRTALKLVGVQEFVKTLRWLTSKTLFQFLNSLPNLRFYAIVMLFLSFVYLYIPRIDFFLCAALFLVVFITSFYFDDATILKQLFLFYLAGTLAFLIFFVSGLKSLLGKTLPFAHDILTIVFIVVYCVYAWQLVRPHATLRKKYRTAMIVAFIAPFVVGMIFKYFLLVPMPSEGLIVTFLDYLWYLEF